MALQIVLEVSDEVLAIMRENAADNDELKDKTDEELVEWVQNSIQIDVDNGDYIADQFNY